MLALVGQPHVDGGLDEVVQEAIAEGHVEACHVEIGVNIGGGVDIATAADTSATSVGLGRHAMDAFRRHTWLAESCSRGQSKVCLPSRLDKDNRSSSVAWSPPCPGCRMEADHSTGEVGLISSLGHGPGPSSPWRLSFSLEFLGMIVCVVSSRATNVTLAR